MESVDVRRRLPGDDLIVLSPIRSADRDVDRGCESKLELAVQVHAENPFREPQFPGEEARLIGDARVIRRAEDAILARCTGRVEART